MAGNNTTIKLSKKTKERIDTFRIYKRETYDEILQAMLTILNLCKVDPERARARLAAVDHARRKIKSARDPFAEPTPNLAHNHPAS